jgi:hypothetical protein
MIVGGEDCNIFAHFFPVQNFCQNISFVEQIYQ